MEFIPQSLLDLGAIQMEEAKAKLRSWRDATEEQVEEEAGRMTFEILRAQRHYMEAAFIRAKNRAQAMGIFPNRNDYMTTVENFYCADVATAMCTQTDALGGRLANDIDGLAQRCVTAEAGSSKKDRLIDALKDEVYDLNLELNRARGAKK